MALRSLVTASLAALVALAGAAGAAAREPALSLPVGYVDPAAAHLADRAWTYDAALWATAHAVSGETAKARAILDDLAAAQAPNGAVDSSFDVRTGAGAGPTRSGTIAWVGLAAAQYRTTTCSARYDGMLEGVARWLLAMRTGALVKGGPDVGWISTEHNLEARAFLASLAALAGGRTACPGGLGGRVATSFVADLDAAVADLDAAIAAQLLAGDHFRQGAGDDARPVDVQAFGIQWLIGQGRVADAQRVAAYADAHLRLRWGYRPYAESWTPDVVWTEGTLQMRMAKAALGQDTSAIDAAVGGLPRRAGLLRHADRELRHQVGEYHLWPASAPAAWERLAGSDFALLRHP